MNNRLVCETMIAVDSDDIIAAAAAVTVAAADVLRRMPKNLIVQPGDDSLDFSEPQY